MKRLLTSSLIVLAPVAIAEPEPRLTFEEVDEQGNNRNRITVQVVTDEIAESLGMDEAMGALISGVIEGGPVSDGSIEPGDVIITFDGREVRDTRE